MAILTESPWYQEILNRGRQEEIISGIELGLELKFGENGLEILPEISSINDLDKLKLIRRGIKTVNSLAELRELL